MWLYGQLRWEFLIYRYMIVMVSVFFYVWSPKSPGQNVAQEFHLAWCGVRDVEAKRFEFVIDVFFLFWEIPTFEKIRTHDKNKLNQTKPVDKDRIFYQHETALTVTPLPRLPLINLLDISKTKKIWSGKYFAQKMGHMD